eukprot:TRINITY_DN432_c1_g1_i1.p1 TRINITY_DN432_c1_g1~~TRINITY_DN432_c1_g1_i1.p1  ORF type:complete len:380 (+),score=99.54 TRINITY_DN432_c1_g1_i1:171-1310(+)
MWKTCKKCQQRVLFVISLFPFSFSFSFPNFDCFFSLLLLSMSERRKKKVGSSELQRLKTNVEDLQEVSAEQEKVGTELYHTLEFLQSQIFVLREAYRTLSDVVVEEVREIRRDAKIQHDDFAQELCRVAASVKSLRSEFSVAQAASASLGDNLEMRVSQQDAALEALRVTWDKFKEQTQSSLELVETQCRSILHTEGRGLGVGDDQFTKMQRELVSLRRQHTELRQDHMSAVSALARDVSSLADDGASLRGKIDMLDSAMGEWRKQIDSEREHHESDMRRHDDWVRRVDTRLEQLHTEWETAQKGITQCHKAQTGFDSAMGECRAGIRSLDAAFKSLRVDIDASVAEAVRASKRRFDSLRAGVGVLSTSMGIPNPVVSV